MQCEQAPRTNKLAHPPYSIHNFDAKGRMRRAGISSKIIHPTASEHCAPAEKGSVWSCGLQLQLVRC